MAHHFQLDEAWLSRFIKAGLSEDVGTGDITSLACVPASKKNKAILKVKDFGVIAGVELARRIFLKEDKKAVFTQLIADGAEVSNGQIAFEVVGNTRMLLRTERLVLNAMQRMSGVATMANRFRFEVEGLPVTILDTRKTAPLMRHLEKWAVHLGGCTNYRDGLYDWFMIKDNHVQAAGGVREAIEKVHEYQKKFNKENFGITVEVRNLDELDEALAIGGFTRIMLDNFEPAILKIALDVIDGRYESEASGGILLNNVRKFAETGVQFISVGALTHSAQSLDLSLKIID